MINGIINVYKESGYTSHDVVAKLRGILKQKKIGHTGTLDPEAQGVLPVCLGKATKICDLLTDKTKEYRAVLRLGLVTDTQDMTGVVLKKTDVTCTEDEIRACISRFAGVQEQIPPMYSALKVGGKKLYELARQGIEVERKPRQITIERILVEDITLPEVTFTVVCSKGTYIRTLCHDIGAALGCGGCMESLLRTKAGPFLLEDSVTLDEIVQCKEEGRLPEVIHPTDSVFSYLPEFVLTREAERLVRNGNPLRPEILGEPGITMDPEIKGEPGITMHPEFMGHEGRAPETGALGESGRAVDPAAGEKEMWVRLYGAGREFLAIYRWDKEKACYRAVKMFL